MKRKQILILLMGAMMALSACQATPEEDVIVQKAGAAETDAGSGCCTGTCREITAGADEHSGDDQFSGDGFQRKACLYG